jgi:antitoxin component HigA of HigAB toxin-antitoxin module
MSTKKKNNPEHELLLKELQESLAFNNDDDKLEFEAEMLSLDLVSVIQALMEEREIKKSHLSKKLGLSKSFITTVFSGDKLVNLKLLAKIQRALDVKFTFEISEKVSKTFPIHAYEYKNKFEELRNQMRVVRDEEEDYKLSKSTLRSKTTSLAS